MIWFEIAVFFIEVAFLVVILFVYKGRSPSYYWLKEMDEREKKRRKRRAKEIEEERERHKAEREEESRLLEERIQKLKGTYTNSGAYGDGVSPYWRVKESNESETAEEMDSEDKELVGKFKGTVYTADPENDGIVDENASISSDNLDG